MSPTASRPANRFPRPSRRRAGFPVIYTTTLLAGERSGNLQEVLERYVSFQRISLTFRKKLHGVADLSRRCCSRW